MEKLFSVPETAKQLGGVSVWSVYAWLSKGLLERTKVRRRTMVSEGAIQRFLAECQRNDRAAREGAGRPRPRKGASRA